MEISVIIPVYNAERFVERAVHSALSQRETGEVLLIDDASTDGSWAICKQLANENEKVKLFQHTDKQNRGPGATRNIGLKNAAYDFIAFLDADDYYVDNRFKTAKKIFTLNESVDGVYEYVRRFKSKNNHNLSVANANCDEMSFRVIGQIKPDQLFHDLVISKECSISLIGMTLKIEIFKSGFIFDEKLRHFEDTDLIWRMSMCYNLVPGDQNMPVSFSELHGGNMSLNKSQVSYRVFLFYRKWKKLIIENNWGIKTNRDIVNKYMYYSPLMRPFQDIGILRISIKLFMLVVLFVKHPVMIRKLL